MRPYSDNAGNEAEYIRSLRCQLVELHRQLEHEHSLRMRLGARKSQLETRSADERRKRVTELFFKIGNTGYILYVFSHTATVSPLNRQHNDHDPEQSIIKKNLIYNVL